MLKKQILIIDGGLVNPLPNIEVLVSSINIMETQITETGLKSGPPDLLIQPRLGYLKFLEFNRTKKPLLKVIKRPNLL